MKPLQNLIFLYLGLTCFSYGQSFEDYIEQGDSLLRINYLKADSLYSLAKYLALHNNDKRQKGIALLRKARIYTNNTDYDESLKLLDTALKTFTELKDTLLMADAESDMGLVYRYTKDFGQAAIQNKKALDLWMTQNDSTLIGVGYRDLGVIYRKLKQLEKARRHYEIAGTYLSPLKDRDKLVTLNGNFATLEFSEGNYKTAIDLNKRDLKYVKSKSEWRALSTRYNNIAFAYIKLEDYNNALIYSDSAITAAEKSNLLDSKIRAIRTQNRIFKNTENYKKAYENYRLYKTLSDSALNLEKAKEVAKIITINNYENQKKVDSLQFASEKALLEQTLQKQTSQKRLYFLIGVLALSALFFLWMAFKQRRKRLEEQLKTTEREASRLIEEAKHRTTYKQSILKVINSIFEAKPKDYKTELSQLRYKLNEDIRHESESLFNHKEVSALQNRLDEKLQNQYPALTKSERQMCSYLIAGLSTKEIAELKQTSLMAVRSMRYRVRKKLGLQDGEELQAVIENI